MELADLISILLSKGVEHVLSELPQLIRDKKVEKDDLMLILNYALLERLKSLDDGIKSLEKELGKRFKSLEREIGALRSDVKEMHKDLKEMHKDLRERLDLINNQLRVLNANIASTYELTSKVVAMLMAKGTPLPS
ncbi:hypothetical protein [Pyrobaculum aerophilum]|uniref:Uncharacterized protein n=1 Tax=Pyrobaculum aerophilum TaxID=13773 RepID=A0A371QWG3_9CREN|nr:hypothetical protein [Pyrobaculum aerophilum]RFA94644.1 hypothetical protein CGL52_14015 [Pyrobaculum aerophilum]RFA96098.1 hypothetical protein CGL51_06110 [Pyrobaculum aerophilum]